MERSSKNPLILEAIGVCGSQGKLAEAIEATGLVSCVQQTVSKLLHGELRIDADFAIAIDRATEGRVPRHKLRPDLFESPAGMGAAA